MVDHVNVFHVFFTAASRIIVNKLFSVSDELNFFVGLVAGILGPVFVYLIAKRIPLMSLLLLGEKENKKLLSRKEVK